MHEPHGEHVTGHPTHAPAASRPLPFSDVEWESFQAADRGAGRAVISLLAGIFSIGLVLYLGVIYWIFNS
jgi:hypothetical protein